VCIDKPLEREQIKPDEIKKEIYLWKSMLKFI
jgi:hypothetical protein